MKCDNTGLFMIRLGLGILFVFAGFGKLTGVFGPGIKGFSGMVWGSLFLAWIIALGELLGGISLLTGVWTKYSTIGLSIIMLGAIFMASIPGLDSANPMTLISLLSNVVILTSLLGVMFMGPGKCCIKK
jgi:putative oxidoreductase